MSFTSVILYIFLTSLASALPAGDLPNPTLGSWTLSNNYIACSDDSCSYSFRLERIGSSRPDSADCNFVVKSAANFTAGRTDFKNVPCTLGSDYLVSGGHSANLGNVVLYVYEILQNNWAWFGYDTNEFVSGPSKTSPVYGGPGLLLQPCE
ncbi:hypothetical protein TruAng_000764 [Truncatella angustata]|nr:hypothetical protein TruAng_000764 [Truncatella angustata]